MSRIPCLTGDVVLNTMLKLHEFYSTEPQIERKGTN